MPWYYWFAIALFLLAAPCATGRFLKVGTDSDIGRMR